MLCYGMVWNGMEWYGVVCYVVLWYAMFCCGVRGYVMSGSVRRINSTSPKHQMTPLLAPACLSNIQVGLNASGEKNCYWGKGSELEDRRRKPP